MADGGVVQFLSTVHGGEGQENSPLLARNHEFSSSSSSEDDDMQPINGLIDFAREFFKESKKLWCLAGPSIFTSFCQYGRITITQIFVGHLGNNQLAAVSMENSIISGFPYGLMYEMLGIYTQRTWVVLISMAFASMPLFIFATPVLKFLGQTDSVSSDAGKFSLWMIPEHFAYAMTFPSAKFLQAQSKVTVLAVIAATVLCLHAFLSWLLITVLGWGLAGAAVALDASWLCIAIAQFSFIICGTFSGIDVRLKGDDSIATISARCSHR